MIASATKFSTLLLLIPRKIDMELEPPNGVGGEGLSEISPRLIRIEILMSLFAMYLDIVTDSVTELSAPVP